MLARWRLLPGLLVAWCGLSHVRGITAAEPAARPNVLLIVSEDNGPQFGCYADNTVPTPHVDRLAASGTRFSRAFVTQAVCSPSRGSILTGLYPHQNGQIGLATHQFTMVRNWPTLPGLMQAAGYRTGLIGKLHVLPEDAFAFDWRWADPQLISFAHRDVRQTAEKAAEFIRQNDRPFFLAVNYADAHLPFLPQDTGLPARPLTAAEVRTPAAVGVDTPRLREHAANYYNCLSRLDTGIGMLLEQLAATGRDKNTLVIYLGDHGPQFARGKVTCYEFGLRIPLIVRWPGKVVAGVRDELVSTVDLLPTILDAVGANLPEHLPGRSLLPLLRGERTAWREHLFCEWNSSHPHPAPSLLCPERSVRDDRYKLIHRLHPGAPHPCERYYTTQALVKTGPTEDEIAAGGPLVRQAYKTWRSAPEFELYDLEQDPHEFVNLAERPDLARVRSRLLAALTRWRTDTNDPLLSATKQEQLFAEDLERATQAAQTGRRPETPWRYPQYLYGPGR